MKGRGGAGYFLSVTKEHQDFVTLLAGWEPDKPPWQADRWPAVNSISRNVNWRRLPAIINHREEKEGFKRHPTRGKALATQFLQYSPSLKTVRHINIDLFIRPSDVVNGCVCDRKGGLPLVPGVV